MTLDIDFDPKVAHAVDAELAQAYEAAQQASTVLEGYAQDLSTYWSAGSDEASGINSSSAEVAGLLLDYKAMYVALAERITKLRQRLKETERIVTLQKATQLAKEGALRQKMAQAASTLRERYPDYADKAKIGPDLYRRR